MMAFGQRSTDTTPLSSEINMIPLIDIMLVLLIIFMLTMPAITHRIGIDLPAVDTRHSQSTTPTLIIEIHSDGRVMMDDAIVSLQDFSSYLSSLPTDTRLQIAAAEDVPYRHVATVLGQLQEHGLNHIDLLTRPR